MIAKANAAALATFGEVEGFIHHDGSVAGRPFDGIWDDPSERVKLFSDGLEVQTSGLRITTLDSEADGIERNDSITRKKTGKTYRLMIPDPDGAGMTVLTLSEDEGEG